MRRFLRPACAVLTCQSAIMDGGEKDVRVSDERCFDSCLAAVSPSELSPHRTRLASTVWEVQQDFTCKTQWKCWFCYCRKQSWLKKERKKEMQIPRRKDLLQRGVKQQTGETQCFNPCMFNRMMLATGCALNGMPVRFGRWGRWDSGNSRPWATFHGVRGYTVYVFFSLRVDVWGVSCI